MDKTENPEQEAATQTPAPVNDGKTILVFSDDMDKAFAAFVIANGAALMDCPTTMFFAFWGLNVLRKPASSKGKDLLAKMFGAMMPKGANKLKLSKMHMMGMGSAMMKYVMKRKNVQSLPQMIATARDQGVRMIACGMSMDVMGIRKDEFIDGVEVGGVVTFLDAAEKSNVTLVF
ncbi:MAG: DsrE/DsrF/DrsH-like family protein [Alphaproteobacteria bacterium]|nr:DsrE/DsrF/DrsH-like family protein [Alphaproteobacteria bacterium]MDE1985956.1 DsrE/DsrF/DrsH-like family protein [Alphaproteobacteria bacterium]MDE2163369.1 DsrE/DsrF/DrsH-like family protein [Alphaproteobacteria bacterium]MDE2267283.1 DsrE/DsrF/DrsH-like family protein [Alphaproteobacteria bacterium]MDE2500568.1 DsrE/DsrF/DrsH-like family protein [Alphaproteobacteria bacterium]